MKQMLPFFLIILLVLTLSAGCMVNKISGTKPQTVDTIHRNMSFAEIPQLKEIITSSADNQTREMAVMAMTDIAMNANRSQDILPFLKDIVLNEKDPTVRHAAYANLDVIRKYQPSEIWGTQSIRVEGDLRPGNKIRLVVDVTPSVDTVHNLVGIQKILVGRERSNGITLISPELMPVRFSSAAGISHEVPFTLYLNKSGKYSVYCYTKINVNRIDYQTFQKIVDLTVNTDKGSYTVRDENDWDNSLL